MKNQKRGELTPRIKEKSKNLMGYEISQDELRLMAYLQYQIMNEQRIDPGKVNSEERTILSNWRKAGYIEGGVSGLGITQEFWDTINQILFLGYVDID